MRRREPPGLWQYDARGSIWKIVPGSDRLLVGESRDTSAKTASYFCVSLDDGGVRWEGVQFAGGWWTGIETVHRGVLIVHEYPDPGMPDHRKIFAVDLHAGRELWRNDDLAFAFVRGESVYASKDRFDRRDFFRLDLATGVIAETVPAEDLGALRASPGDAWEMDIQVPSPAGTGEPPAAAGPILDALRKGAVLEPGETLFHEDMEIANWYEVLDGPGVIPDRSSPPQTAGAGPARRRLREHLFVLRSGSNDVLFHDEVCDDLSHPSGAAFFRAEERIVYVRRRTMLRSFPLREALR